LQTTQTNAAAIATAAHTIRVLWHDANLIAHKLANPHRDDNTGGSHSHSTPSTPVSLSDMTVLDSIQQWLTVASTACGLPYDQTLNATPQELADYVCDNAITLASQPDAIDWATDAVSASTSIRLICDETTQDPTRWHGALVDWNPDQIAATLTDLTGRRVKANTISQLKHRGKIEIVNGRVILGEIANALGIKA
jgi:hypothetical protein